MLQGLPYECCWAYKELRVTVSHIMFSVHLTKTIEEISLPPFMYTVETIWISGLVMMTALAVFLKHAIWHNGCSHLNSTYMEWKVACAGMAIPCYFQAPVALPWETWSRTTPQCIAGWIQTLLFPHGGKNIYYSAKKGWCSSTTPILECAQIAQYAIIPVSEKGTKSELKIECHQNESMATNHLQTPWIKYGSNYIQ